MTERQSSVPEEEHGVALVRLAAQLGTSDGLSHLKKEFAGLEVSIYSLPIQNTFNFALIGAFSESVVAPRIEMAKHNGIDLFESYQINTRAARRVYHGTSITPYAPDIADVLNSTKVPDFSVPRLYGMLFLDTEIWDFKALGRIRAKLKETLPTHGLNAPYCLSALDTKGWDGQDPPNIRERRLFTSQPLGECNCWIRVSVDLKDVENTIDALSRMDGFYDVFKRKLDNPVTMAFYPALLEHPSREIASRETYSRTILKEKFPKYVAKTFWFGFGVDGHSKSGASEASDADIEFPITNYVISASSGTGKTNAALAIVDAFVRWQLDAGENWEHSPGFDRFDVLYVNLKAKPDPQAADASVGAENEARLLKAFAKTRKLKVECVRAGDLQEYFLKGHAGDPPAIVYSEPDGLTSWLSAIDAITSATCRAPRGLLLIVDEAFKPSMSVAERADLDRLYQSVLKTWRTRGVRMVLIGQEMTGKGGVLEFFGEELVDLASLVIGSQENTAELETLLIKGFEKDESIIDWLQTKGSGKVVELAARIKPSFRKVGPIVVRAALSGTKCLPVPCHVRPADLTGVDLGKLDVTWWKLAT